jgi:hypothetical protein
MAFASSGVMAWAGEIVVNRLSNRELMMSSQRIKSFLS